MPDTHTHRSPAAADTGHACACTRQHVWVLFDFWWRHPQPTHQRAKDRQWKLHLIPLAYWASQLSTPQCSLCFFLWLPCWLSLPLCLVLLPREKALCSCRKHRDTSQQSANLRLQIPVSTERQLVSHYPSSEKKKLRGTIHLLVSYLWGHFVG